jgi:hypothetical protein
MNAFVPGSSVYQQERPSFVTPNITPSSRGLVARLSVSTARVRVNTPASSWSSALSRRFDELVSLPKGWDCYSGIAVTFTTAKFAADLLERLFVDGVPEPQLVPGSDGSVQIEWHVNGFDVELDVLAPYEVSAIRRNITTNVVEELELQTDFTALTSWIAGLKIAGTPLEKMRG